LFNHLSHQLAQVRSSVSEALQSRYDYYTASPSSQLSAQVVDDIARQLTSLTAIINYTDKVRSDLVASWLGRTTGEEKDSCAPKITECRKIVGKFFCPKIFC